jgi:hypothetical protein
MYTVMTPEYLGLLESTMHRQRGQEEESSYHVFFDAQPWLTENRNLVSA